MAVLKRTFLWLSLCLFLLPLQAQEFQPTPAQRGVRTSGDVAVGMLAAAGVTAVLVQKDWQGLKQGALSGVTTLGVTYALKYLVKKERPDHSDFHSFPSMHTSAAFTAAAFIQRRYGWKWGAPAYALSAYVGWTRVFGKKHDWWDVATGAAIGVGSSYIYTRPFMRKHDVVLAPVAAPGCYGLYASMRF